MSSWRTLIVSICTVLCLSGCDRGSDAIYGYSEGRFRLMSMEVAGRLAQVSVQDGQSVKQGTVLATLDASVVAAELDQARARMAAAQARLADAQAGGRTQEINAAQDRLARAQASARNAQQSYDRIKPLFDKGVVAKSRLDSVEAAMRETKASVAEAAQQFELASLPARTDEIAARAADFAAAKAAVRAHERRLAQMSLAAPTDGLIERVLRDEGEPAGPSAPVIRFLPDGERKAILFVTEEKRPSIPLGRLLTIECDGCATTFKAKVDRLSSEAEFTSPMIFSDVQRSRLTYRLEARFLGAAPPSGMPIWVVIE